MPIIKQTPPRVVPPAIQHHDNRELQTRFPRLAPLPEKQGRPQPAVVSTPSPTTPSAVIRGTTQPITRQNDEERHRSAPPQSYANTPEHRDPSSLTGSADKRATSSPSPVQRRSEVPGREVKPREVKQKKVWKVITTEQGSEKDLKEKDGREHKGRR
jgi:hypothetical protein